MTATLTAPRRSAPDYPVRLSGTPDARLSRGLWLVKVVLVIPHVVVLAVLWLAVVVVTVVAGVAILVTGRYPRPLFDFTLGVLRWSWRVGFYSFSAFGTDRYPPFSLGECPDQPARLDVDYPDHLSRGLVLVKWWLLAIPHYLVVGVLAGGGHSVGGGGLISLLAVIAGAVLLVTGRYPRDLFDFVMGLNRWCYRVAAYVLLLRDEYPPFRLDTGGIDPAPAPSPEGRP